MDTLNKLFEFQMSPGELILRGTLIYWFLFLLFRFVLRRDAGSISLADILVIVVIADASQNGMAGEYKSVGEGLVLITTIAGWSHMIDRLSFHFPAFAKFAEPRALSIVRHGRVLRANLRREFMTEEELASQLRLNGIENISEVKHAILEPDGHISVIRYKREHE